MKYEILNHLEDVVKIITVSTEEEAQDAIYDLKERHGFYMEFSLNEVE